MKKALIWAIMMLAVVTAVMAAYPTTTISNPATGATISGSYAAFLNMSAVTDDWDNETTHNCSWYIYSSSTANSSATTLIAQNNTFNITGIATISLVNVTIDTTTLEDASDYSFKAVCVASNTTARTSTDTNTGITIDNTAPVTPSSLSPADGVTDSSGDVKFSAVVNGVNTTGCTLVFPTVNPGSGSYAMTHSGNNCSISFVSGTFPDGIYSWYVTATDGTNSSSAGIIEMKADLGGITPGGAAVARASVAAAAAAGGKAEDAANSNTTVVVILLLVAGYFVAKEAKLLK